MTSAPAGAQKAAAENTDAIANSAAEQKKTTKAGSRKEAEPLPSAPGPNDPVEDGKVEVTRKATEDELKDPEVGTDPTGNISEVKKTTRAPRAKKDPLKTVTDFSKLPVAVHVGQVAAQIKEYSGQAVLSIGLVGWVGEPEFQIRAEDIGELEDALASLREQLA